MFDLTFSLQRVSESSVSALQFTSNTARGTPRHTFDVDHGREFAWRAFSCDTASRAV